MSLPLSLTAFHKSWERFKEMLRIYPHDEVPRWKLVQSFYSGLNEQDGKIVDTFCGGKFACKTTNEV